MKRIKLAYVLAILLGFGSCKKAAKIAPVVEQEMIISDFVGANAPAFKDGIGEGSAFNRPFSMVIDASGNIFVADTYNVRIRKVTPNGEVSTFVGNGIAGFKDGTGTSAQIGDGDNAITIDAQNNLYLADRNNSCIRKITPNGVVSTLTGAPGRSNIDGPIATAGVSFAQQADITTDPSNNIYFIDVKGIRKISTNGIVSTILKSGSNTTIGSVATATVQKPYNITTDRLGNIYIASITNFNHIIIKIGIDGIVSYYAGDPDQDSGYNVGLSLAAKFYFPRALTADKSGNIFVVDNNHTLTKITTDGFVRLVAGIPYIGPAATFIPGIAIKATLSDPADVAIAPNGDIYTLDTFSSSIRKISLVDKPTTPLTQADIDKANWNKATNWK